MFLCIFSIESSSFHFLWVLQTNILKMLKMKIMKSFYQYTSWYILLFKSNMCPSITEHAQKNRTLKLGNEQIRIESHDDE